MSNTTKPMSNQSIYIAMKLPIDEELYLVDFHPIFNREKVRFITTYLCLKAYSTKEKFWFGNRPCHKMDQSMLIYQWYNNVPAVQWPKDAGFRVGLNTPYRYVVIQMQYITSIVNDIYGQQIVVTRTRPKYKIGSYQIVTSSVDIKKNRVDFSCQYHLSSMRIFSTYLYSNNQGESVSLYRLRKNQLQKIIKGNLHWPKTFYQLNTFIEIQNNDYFIGTCVNENQSPTQTESSLRDATCQIQIMFLMDQNDDIPLEMCLDNDFPDTIERYLPNDVNIPPASLFDIHPAYPKLTPDQWLKYTTSRSLNNKTNILSLTYIKEEFRYQKNVILFLVHSHQFLFILTISLIIFTIALLFLILIILLLRSQRRYFVTNNNRSKKIIVGGETSSLSGWLTKRRFQQYDHDDNNDKGETQPLTQKTRRRWTSESEESELSDNDVFNRTDYRHVILKN